MIFHSIDFLLFLAVVLTVYWSLGRRLQNVFLLAASYFFYGYIHSWFLILILISTVVDYYCGIQIGAIPAGQQQRRKKRYLYLSLVTNLGILCVFKYLGFFVDNIIALLELAGVPGLKNTLSIVLPVGISFYTFQTLSYTIDVYRGRLAARKDFFDFALFVAFFPQLVAGPIERAGRLLPQMEKARTFSVNDWRNGLFLIIWGFFKKLVIADNVAVIANKIFLLENVNFYLLWVGAFAFTVQLFADFSAYSDIARGVARLLGFSLMRNFDHPFIAISPSDFWNRWHISLSTWIRDYLFFPLLGARLKKLGSLPMAMGQSVMISFFLMGLWHGASWNMVGYGMYHGVLTLVYSGLGAKIPKDIQAFKPLLPLRMALMFLLIVTGMLIFREPDFHYLGRYFFLSPLDVPAIDRQVAFFLLAKTLIYSLPIWLHALVETVHRRIATPERVQLVFNTVAAALMFLAILTMRSRLTIDFIYFQF